MGFVWSDVKPSKLINSNRAAFWIPGFAVASWGPFIPYVKERFALTEDHLGLLLMCMAIGAAGSMFIASGLMTKFGCRLMAQIGGVMVACCLAAVTIAPSYHVLCTILIIFGFNSELLAIAANVNAASLERLLNRNIMSGLHGVYSLGNSVGVFLVALFLGSGLTFMMGNLLLTSCVVSVLIILYCALIGSRYMLTDLKVVDDAAHKNEGEAATTQKKGPFITPMLFLLGLICFIMFITEGSMLDWTGVFLNTIRGVPLHEAGYGFAAFSIMMTICRLTGDKVVATLGRRRVLVMGAIIVIAGICLAVMVPHPMVAIVGFGMVGLGAANIVPQTISYAATVKEVPIQRSVLVVNAIGYIGALLGPALIGFIAHRIGLEFTFLILAAAVIVVVVIAYTKIRSGNIATLTAAAA